MPDARPIRLLIVAACLALAACSSGSPDESAPEASVANAPSPAVTDDSGPTEATSTTALAPGVDEADPACASFRTFVVQSAPCDGLVRPLESVLCTTATGESVDCTAVPRAARVIELAGAVIGGQPLRPSGGATQIGRGPGPTNTSLLLLTAAPVPTETPDQLELAVVYDDPGGRGCETRGDAWDGAVFASILRLGPGPARVTDLACRGDDFTEITQRSTWLVESDVVIVHLPVDLPGFPSRVTATFRPAPDFVFEAGRIMTTPLDPDAWRFDEPIRP